MSDYEDEDNNNCGSEYSIKKKGKDIVPGDNVCYYNEEYIVMNLNNYINNDNETLQTITENIDETQEIFYVLKIVNIEPIQITIQYKDYILYKSIDNNNNEIIESGDIIDYEGNYSIVYGRYEPNNGNKDIGYKYLEIFPIDYIVIFKEHYYNIKELNPLEISNYLPYEDRNYIFK